MVSLLDRLRRALAPDYEIHEELAQGGMGVVFLGHDVRLDRKVAVKVLRPELSSAAAATRFVREARILASLSHSNIVPVHAAGEADGIFYSVMDYVDGETLFERLQRGPLSREEAMKFGRDLLDALEVVHDRGVIHRDIKPANLFLIGNRTLLGDFGIAKPGPDQGESLTDTGGLVGTPDYMPPEQFLRNDVTHRTDLYAAAMVIYEALTGRRWTSGAVPGRADWSGVPRRIARVLARALAIAPEERWPEAATFRRKLWRSRTPRYRIRTAAVALSGVAVGIVIANGPRNGAEESRPGTLSVQLMPFTQEGAADEPWIADSVSAVLRRDLKTSSDFRLLPAGESGDTLTTVTLEGTVIVAGATVTIEVRSGRRPVNVSSSGARDRWRAVSDSVSFGVLRSLWSGSSPWAKHLPVAALPTTTHGFNAWLGAERLFNSSQWESARAAYNAVIAVDSTCWLCSWRVSEIERQIALETPDPRHVQRVLARIDLFLPHQQPLIEVENKNLTLAERLDILEEAAQRFRDVYYVQFRLGEELYNRGALSGRLRREAIEPLQKAARRRPEFGPTWEHLTWVLTAEGDSGAAAQALETLEARSQRPDHLILARTALAYRFTDAQLGPFIVRDTAALRVPGLAAGPRLLPAFDAPNGSVDLGQSFTTVPDREDLRRSGFVAQLLGHFAMGQMEAAAGVVTQIDRALPEAVWFPLFAAQLDAAMTMFDSGGVAQDPNEVARALELRAAPGSGTPEERLRAVSMLTLLARRVDGYGRALRSDARASEPEATPLALLLEADSLALAGRLQQALLLGDSLRLWESAGQVPGPFFRTVLHLLRAEWYEATGNMEAARSELRWHENWDADGLPTGPVKVQEVDWAFGTLARWRRGQLLDRMGVSGVEPCAVYGGVVRQWGRGDPPYAARSVLARKRFEELGCDSDPANR